jgi:hypothetical protein
MAILLDYEDSTEMCWTISAELNGVTVAAMCCNILEQAQTRMDLFLIEYGYDVYGCTEIDGLKVY